MGGRKHTEAAEEEKQQGFRVRVQVMW